MKLALDYKKLHLRFFCGIGFALFLLTNRIKRENPQEAENIRAVSKQIKKLLKDYKRKNGAFNLVEIESDGTHVTIRV